MVIQNQEYDYKQSSQKSAKRISASKNVHV